jgi:1,2-diacylglycerol 3-alpha-glucosyltransferase
MKRLGILWSQYGPYHIARVAAMKKQAGPLQVHALELSDQTSDYQWKRSPTLDLITLCPGSPAEQLSFQEVFRRSRRILAELKIEVCFLPSYAPKQSLAALMAAKSLGLRTVMMNESHAGTARARGAAAWLKRRLASLFDAAFVGGAPQRRYFASLGFPQEKIFTGYDAVDNDYFALKANQIRERKEAFRNNYDLPERYFLSLGRFVVKKNLATLIRAYRIFLDSNRDDQVHLVMVGSGEEVSSLISLCKELCLPAYDKISVGTHHQKAIVEPPGVHFYGFRQIEENPVFYALAEAFVLPSLWEEWGLVVNEAMASGLPVIVSETAGCAEDLLQRPLPAMSHAAPPGVHIRRNGCVFDSSSDESLSLALLALAAAPALREAMGKASQAIVDTFSCEAFARNALLAARTACGENIPAPCDSLVAEPRLDVARETIS